MMEEIRTLTALQDDSGGFHHLGHVGHQACLLVGRESMCVTADVAFCVHVMMRRLTLPFSVSFLSLLVEFFEAALGDLTEAGGAPSRQDGPARTSALTVRAQVAFVYFVLVADSAEQAVDGASLAMPDGIEPLIGYLQAGVHCMSAEGIAWYILSLIESQVGEPEEVRRHTKQLLDAYEREQSEGFVLASELCSPCRVTAVCVMALLRARGERMLEEDFELTARVRAAIDQMCARFFAFAGARVDLSRRSVSESIFELAVAHLYATTTGENTFAVSQCTLGEYLEDVAFSSTGPVGSGPAVSLTVNGKQLWAALYKGHHHEEPMEVCIPITFEHDDPCALDVRLAVGAADEAGAGAGAADSSGTSIPYDLLFFGRAPYPRALSCGLEISRSYSALGPQSKPIVTKQGRVEISCGSPVVITLTVTNYEPLEYVSVVDRLPAGLQAPPESPFPRPMYTSKSDGTQQDPLGELMAAANVFDHRRVGLEMGWHLSHLWGNDRVVSARGAMLFSTRLYPGRHHFSYIAVASSVGEFFAPPAAADLMFARGEMYARSDAVLVRIV
eukprot:TRINITY_DN4178_c0_g1_i4.p1 TRINITY_DN4178_c0_g1~~TRINITY_DN4178_c0_g1_i4.p1  ORF type:complete len:592 (-),score=243.40 TRINITY_DN4178_c0_g1_i4:258-1934(-)